MRLPLWPSRWPRPAGGRPGHRFAIAGTYLTALASYRAGDLAAAFGKLQELGESEVTEITRRLMRPDVAAASSWPRLLTAAILLHTEAFLIRSEAGGPAATDAFLLSAHLLVRRLLQLADDGQPGIGEKERMFARDWYLLLVAVQHGRSEVGWSRAYLEEALKSFPKDPHLTVALGSNHEMLSDLSAGYVAVLRRLRPVSPAGVSRCGERAA